MAGTLNLNNNFICGIGKEHLTISFLFSSQFYFNILFDNIFNNLCNSKSDKNFRFKTAIIGNT